MKLYNGIIISEKIASGNLFDGWTQEQLDGVDCRASAERYAEILTEKLEKEFPGAQMDITVQHGVEGHMGGLRVIADYADSVEAMHAEEGIRYIAQDISSDIYTAGEWIVTE